LSEHISSEIKDGVHVIRMNRPEKKNALTSDMYAAMADAVVGADEDPAVRVLVITGSADAFTSGNDLNDFLNNPPSGDDSPVWRFIAGIATTTTPLIAAVNGMAIGIGTTMLLHCDFVYASEQARFHLPFVNLALAPEAASSLLLPRVAGYRQAAELLMLGEAFDADAALDAGIISAIVPAGDLMAMALDTAAKLAAKPPGALRQTKALMRGDEGSVSERLKAEAKVFAGCLTSPEAKEAMTAFFEKRAPDFSKFE
jgi:enoyl-CoA hydratase/carnithine racemase